MGIDQPFSVGDVAIGLGFAMVCFCAYAAMVLKKKDRAVLIGAFIAKMLCCAVYNLILFQSGQGDTLAYHDVARRHAAMIAADLTNGTTTYLTTNFFLAIDSNSTERLSSLCGLVHFLFLGSFLASSVFFAVLGLCGQILLYRVFSERFPHPRIAIWWKLGLLYLPSLVFWSSGILKDTMGIFGMGLSVWGMSRLLTALRLRYLLVLVAGLYLLLMFRPIAVTTLIASFLLWLLDLGSSRTGQARRGRQRQSAFTRLVARLAIILVSIYSLNMLSAMDKRMSVGSAEAVAQRLESQSVSYKGVAAGSTTDENLKFDLSLPGILIVWPQAAALTLYRPFPWEAHNVLMLVASVENTILLAFTLVTAFRLLTGFGHLVDALRYPFFLACVSFTMLFITAVGFSTPNLGSVSRYRIPMLPFFIAILVTLHYFYLMRRYPNLMGVASGQPGFGPPGMGQPGFGPPGMGQPGFGPPGMGQPGFGPPGFGPPSRPDPLGWGGVPPQGRGAFPNGPPQVAPPPARPGRAPR